MQDLLFAVRQLRRQPGLSVAAVLTLGLGLGASHRDVRFLREHVRSCAPIAATVGGSGLNVSLDGRVSHQEDRLVSRGYFEALGVSPTWGRASSLAEDADTPPPVVILNERFLRRQGIDPAAVVGRDMYLGGRAHTIVGVLAAPRRDRSCGAW